LIAGSGMPRAVGPRRGRATRARARARWLSAPRRRRRARRRVPPERGWTATSVARPNRRCSTASSRSTGLASSREPRSRAACRASSCANSRTTSGAACSSTGSFALHAGAAATRCAWPFRVNAAASAPRVSAGACPTSPRTSSTR
jgi:hypothetical protein